MVYTAAQYRKRASPYGNALKFIPIFPGEPEHLGFNELLLCLVARPICSALGVFIPVNQLNHCTRSIVSIAKPRLEDTCIASITVLVALTENIKELFDRILISDLGNSLPACVEIASLRQRDQLIHQWLQLLRLRQGGYDLLVLDQ